MTDKTSVLPQFRFKVNNNNMSQCILIHIFVVYYFDLSQG